MLLVVARDPPVTGDGLLQRAECQQSLADRVIAAKPGILTRAGFPEARYRTVLSLNHPLRVCVYTSWATENSAPEPWT
jgi:hypothetical protein